MSILEQTSDVASAAGRGPSTVALEWAVRRGHRFTGDPAAELSALRAAVGATVSVVIPVKAAPGPVAGVAAACVALQRAGAVDEVIVIDAAVAGDESGTAAAAAGAVVRREDSLLPSFGPVLGKGDAMWRAQAAVTGDIVVYVDGDSDRFDPAFVYGLAAPLLLDGSVELVKGAYRRPFGGAGKHIADGGGRVTELAARPLLNLHFPELAAVRQPLAGEFAARRATLAEMPFLTGYGAEIQLLIDYYRRFGLDAIAQSDIGERINPHQPLQDLGAMAYTVMRALLSRVDGERHAPGRDAVFVNYAGGDPREQSVELVERPPFEQVAARATGEDADAA